MADLAAAFQSAEIVPQIIPNAPKNKLMVKGIVISRYDKGDNFDIFQVNYEGTVLEPGMNFKTNQLRFAPRIQYAGADPEGTYSLVMIGRF